MKKAFAAILMVAVAALAGCSPSGKQVSNEISALVVDLQEAYLAKDTAAIEALGYNKPDATQWAQLGSVLATVSAAEASPPTIWLVSDGETAAVTTTWDFTVDGLGEKEGVVDSFTVRRFEGKWQVNLAELLWCEAGFAW